MSQFCKCNAIERVSTPISEPDLSGAATWCCIIEQIIWCGTLPLELPYLKQHICLADQCITITKGIYILCEFNLPCLDRVTIDNATIDNAQVFTYLDFIEFSMSPASMPSPSSSLAISMQCSLYLSKFLKN